MQALQGSRARTRTADTQVELGPQPPLLCMRMLEARGQAWILGSRAGPTLDASGRLEPLHCRDELRAREPEGGRERLAAVIERVLLRDRRVPERAADDDLPKGPRRPA